MKRKILSLILVFAMTVSLFTVGTGAVEPTYGDTAGHWAESSIERWSGYGIIQGSNGLFDPNGQLTCAQLATILAKLLKLPAAKDAGFIDNTADAWYYDAINRCAAAGILNGNGDGTVTPEAPISRERAIVMIGRALGIEPISKPDLTKYSDAAKVAPYAQGMVAAMIEAGIVGGVTADELAPQANINRASTVTILDRAIAVYADKDSETIDASKANGLILIAAKDVTVKNAPKGTSVLVCKDASGSTVNGKAIDAGASVMAEETQPAKPAAGGGSSGGSSGGSTPSPSNLTVAEAKTVSGGTYQNVTITDAVGNGEVTLTGLTIRGDLTVMGGGSSSIKLIDCIILGRIIMDKLISEGAQQPRLELTNTPVKAVEVKRPAILESADAASGIEAVTALADTTVQGANTKIDKMNVPASAEQPVDLIVNGAEVSQISTNKETSISGDGNGKVETVVAEAPVNVDSATVGKVEVPASAENIVVNVSGDSAIEIKADSGSTKIAADNTGNITVDGDAKDSITPHAHSWDEGVVTKQPTCSEEGVTTYTCTIENCPVKTKTESIEKIPHTGVVDAAVAANCLTAGKTEGKHCSVCGAVIVAQEETKPLGHDFTVAQHDAAQHWLKCSRCDAVNAKADHSYNAHSCDTTAKCIGCDYEKPAGTHSWNSGEITTAATCTENGVKTYTCTACKQTKTEDINALGHDYAADFTVDKAANCTEAGSKSKHCSRCDARDAVTEIPATGHTFAAEWSKDTDCHWHAATCGHTAEVKDKAEHSWNSGVVTTPATTTTTGVKTYTCTVCNVTKTETIPSTGGSAVAPAKGISSIEQQGMYLAISMTAPESMEHIDYFTFSFYDSTREAESLMTGITCKKDELTFYVEASKFDTEFNYDKAKITAIAEAGYANTAWTGDIKIGMNTVTLDYQVTSGEKWWGIDFTKSAPGFFKVEHFASGSDETKPDKESYSYTDESDYHRFIAAAFDEVTPADGGTVKLALGWNPVITATTDGWKLDVTLYTPGTRTNHEHTYSTDWSHDADYHWHAATCGHTMVSEKSEHTWNGDTCAVCGRTKTEDASQGRVCNIRFEQKNDHFQLAWDAPHNAESLNNPRYYIYLQKNDSWVEVGRSKQTLLSYPVDEAGDYTAVRINTTVENDSGRTVLASCEQAVDFKVSFTVGDAPASVTWSKNEESTYDECVTGVTPNVWGVLQLRTSSSEHSSGRLTGEDGVWTAAVDSDSMEKYLASGEYRFLEYLKASVSEDGLTASYTVNQRGDWTACSSESAAKAWITATANALRLEWTPKAGYTGLYYVNGASVGSGTTYSLINTIRNAAQSGTYSFTISTKEDASSNTLTPYVTLENALTVSIDTTKTPNVTIKGLEDGNYKFVSNNGFAGMYDYDLCAPDDSVIREWWAKAGSTAALAPYEGCKFKVRELSWDKTGENLTAVTVSASAEGTFGFTPYDFSAIQTNVADESAFSTAVNKGGKVILENDITITNTDINRGGDVEIDLNGHKLDLGSSNCLAISKAVKFTDNSAEKTGIIAGTSGIRCDAGSKLNLNGITVARITDGGKMRGITIENCKVTYLIQLTLANEMNVVNTDFSGDVQVKIYNSTASFDRCTFAGGSDQNILQLNGNTKVTLDNATFSSGKVSPTGSGNELILKSGTYCFNPTEYVPEGYTVVHDEENSVWTVLASA